MQHFDEHTLELYVLGAREASADRAEIESHIESCHACRTTVGEMRRFHADLAEALESEDAPVLPARALARRAPGVMTASDRLSPAPYAPRTASQKLRYFIIRNPVAAAAAGIGIAACLVGLGMFLSIPLGRDAADPAARITDWNPMFARVNDRELYLEVYNAADDLLWKKKLDGDPDRARIQSNGRITSTVVTDLDGDGMREVVTIAQFADDPRRSRRGLRIFDGRRRLLKDTLFAEEVAYLNRTYSPFINVDGLIVRESAGSPGKEILLSGNSWGRSPRVMIRLNERWETLGRYWHFGDITPFHLQDITGDGLDELFVIGQNDAVDDSPVGSVPVLIVVDPSKIVGRTKSNACPGFHWEGTEAELFYVEFPATSLDSALHRSSSVIGVEPVGDGTLAVAVGQSEMFFTYFLSTDMRVLEVKSNDTILREFSRMRREGSLRGSVDEAYLLELRSRVRYWDGTMARSAVSRVQHATPSRVNIP